MKRRVLILFILLIFVIAGGSGCMANENTGGFLNLPPKDTSEYALSALKEKYGMEFRYLSPWSSSMGKNHQFLATCDGLPGQKILVCVENFRDKNARSVSDNVLACRYAQETEDYLRGCAEDTVGSCRIFYSPAMKPLPSSLSADLSFERFLSESGVTVSATFEFKASDFQTQEQARVLAQRIADTGVRANLTFIAFPDELFGTMDTEQLKTKVATGDYVRYASAACRNGSVELSFREGAA
jgi:hypothetical protein